MSNAVLHVLYSPDVIEPSRVDFAPVASYDRFGVIIRKGDRVAWSQGGHRMKVSRLHADGTLKLKGQGEYNPEGLAVMRRDGTEGFEGERI